jgi:hypothetical protein
MWRFLDNGTEPDTSLGKDADFTAYVGGVRAAHRQKRNFMKLLDQAQWH